MPAFPAKVDECIARYVKLRDSLKAADDAQKDKTRPAREYLEQLNSHLLGLLNASGGDSISTSAGTAYRTEKKSATIADPAVFRQHIINNGEWDMADWKANPTSVEAYIGEKGVPPPGVNYSTTYVVGVRRK